MKLVIITQRDPLFIDTFLKNIDYLAFDNAIIFDVPNFGSGKFRGLIKFIGLFGWKKTFLTTIKALFSKEKSINGLEIKTVEFDEALVQIKSMEWSEQDILLSVSAPKKIDPEILKLFKLKLNFHCGKLPEYAGMMPMFWQIFDGKKHFTITMHKMSADIDEGDILYEENFPFGGDLYEDMVRGKYLSAKIFNKFIHGNLPLKTQKGKPALTLRKYPDKTAIAKVKAMLID